MLKPIRNFQRTFYSVHISHQHALLRTLQNQPSSEQTTTSNNNKNEHPQLHNEIHKAQINLGESNIPLATSVMGMQELIDSPHFQTMVVKQSKFVRAFRKSKHPLVDVAKNVMTNVAPKTLDGENAEKHPVPLPFRGIIVAMVGSIFKPGDKKSSFDSRNKRSDQRRHEHTPKHPTSHSFHGLETRKSSADHGQQTRSPRRGCFTSKSQRTDC